MDDQNLPIPKRGEVWWINFDPSVGGEIQKKRPAVIISNDMANKALNRVQVIPLTSNVKRIYPVECLVTIKGKQSKALADQITTISKLRLVSKLGKVTKEDMIHIERIILLQLGIKR
jgi:mRNA interferase MazF